MPRRFKKFLYASVAVHLLMMLFVLFYSDILGLVPKPETKITWVKLAKGTAENPSTSSYKKSKNLPDSTIREQKDALKEIAKDKKGSDVKTAPSEIKKKNDTPVVADQKKATPNGGVNLNKKPVKPSNIDDALNRVQEQLEKREVQIEAAQIEKEGTGQSQYGSLTNDATDVNPELLAYYTAIKKKINEQWVVIPKTLADGQVLKTKVNVMVDASGNFTSATYDSKSGDESFDLSAMRAIERAAPFPPPPDSIKAEAVSEGFLIEFSPKSVVGSR